MPYLLSTKSRSFLLIRKQSFLVDSRGPSVCMVPINWHLLVMASADKRGSGSSIFKALGLVEMNTSTDRN